MIHWWLVFGSPLYDSTPVSEGNYREPDWFQPLMEVFDRFGFILWPVIAIAGLLAMGWAVFSVVSEKRIPGPQRQGVKKAIVHELRRQLNGMTLEQINKLVGHEREALQELVTEMGKDGMIEVAVNSKGATIYRLRNF